MSYLRLLFHFFGSVYLAIALITISAIAVIAGTFVESATDSHAHAARLTYENPAFKTVLWLYFVNILLAALRRWPFRRQHFGFLTTHLGLLMILGGVLVKSYYGTQGTLALIEGGESDTLLLLDQPVVHVERSGRYIQWKVEPEELQTDEDSGLSAALAAYAPHSEEQSLGWLKERSATLLGLPPIPIGGKLRAALNGSEEWTIRPIKNKTLEEAVAQELANNATLILRSNSSGRHILSLPLKEALESDTPLPGGDLQVSYRERSLHFQWHEELFALALDGAGSIERENLAFLGAPPLQPSLTMEPMLLIIDNGEDEEHLVAIDRYGRLSSASFNRKELHTFMVYDGGYRGYGVNATLPLYPPPSRNDEFKQLTAALEPWLKEEVQLSPPLTLLKEAVARSGEELTPNVIAFLREWDNGGSWLYPEERPLPAKLAKALEEIKWDEELLHAAHWLVTLQSALTNDLLAGRPLLQTLESIQWPLLDSLRDIDDPEELLMAHGQQLLGIADQLPPIDATRPAPATLLSALFRTYGLHYRRLIPPNGWAPPEPMETLDLEAPLVKRHHPIEPLNKWEDNKPLITFWISDGSRQEEISLAYDRYATGLKWPALDGELLLRYQPRYQQLPFNLRLRRGRQTNYLGSDQPYAYEADLFVTDKRNGTREEVRISMNNVHETWDGYRFYLANLTESNGSEAKRAQIVVNHDPAKYSLTYPGGLILSLGIGLLFVQKRFGTT